MRTGRINRALAGLAVATGAIVLAAGSAGAVVRPGGGAAAPAPQNNSSASAATTSSPPGGGAGAPAPQGNSSGPAFRGDAPDLDRVANNISYKAKSVTTVIQAPAGLALHKPVTISIGYFGYNSADRITQDYSPTAGNRIVHNFPDGDGLSHQASVQFYLSEPRHGGGVDSLSFEWQPMITPLYDVSFSPLTFTLLNDCALVGDSDIDVWWVDSSQAYHEDPVSVSGGQRITLYNFAATWSEVSNGSKLYQLYDNNGPRIGFKDQPNGWNYVTPNFGEFHPGGAPTTPVPLVPGTSAHVQFGVDNPDEGCKGFVEYDQTYTLDTYLSL